MALCPDCRTVIPCHCHVTPAVQVRPGLYPAAPDRREGTPAQAESDRSHSDRDDHRDEE